MILFRSFLSVISFFSLSSVALSNNRTYNPYPVAEVVQTDSDHLRVYKDGDSLRVEECNKSQCDPFLEPLRIKDIKLSKSIADPHPFRDLKTSSCYWRKICSKIDWEKIQNEYDLKEPRETAEGAIYKHVFFRSMISELSSNNEGYVSFTGFDAQEVKAYFAGFTELISDHSRAGGAYRYFDTNRKPLYVEPKFESLRCKSSTQIILKGRTESGKAIVHNVSTYPNQDIRQVNTRVENKDGGIFGFDNTGQLKILSPAPQYAEIDIQSMARYINEAKDCCKTQSKATCSQKFNPILDEESLVQKGYSEQAP